MDPVLIYITTVNREEANCIATALLQKKMIACANIVDSVTAVYWWEGSIQNSQEAILIVKTLDSHVENVTDMVRKMHTYACPALLAIPVTGGNAEYIAWMREQLH